MTNLIQDSLDATDCRILEHMQEDCRITLGQLSERINLSQTPCWRRLKKLEDSGLIAGYRANIDKKKAGYSVVGFSQVSLNDHTPGNTDHFEQIIHNFDWVLMCYCTAGSGDYILQIIAKNLDEFYERITEIRRIQSVGSIQTSVGIKEVKWTNRVPVRPSR
ncbi:Lrp/AsnC family transcriptional regulator [Allohahella sp. A8]|uniref:Lrp/AsnC family transcriptional regulator n=1 Tax=Allohahella sp. A8 TaxID=3141461 RepID=UPI003A8062B1